MQTATLLTQFERPATWKELDLDLVPFWKKKITLIACNCSCRLILASEMNSYYFSRVELPNEASNSKFVKLTGILDHFGKKGLQLWIAWNSYFKYLSFQSRLSHLEPTQVDGNSPTVLYRPLQRQGKVRDPSIEQF